MRTAAPTNSPGGWIRLIETILAPAVMNTLGRRHGAIVVTPDRLVELLVDLHVLEKAVLIASDDRAK